MFDRYDPSAFEAKWRTRWKEADLFRTREEAGRPKFYCLDFFPYPSGAGLSVGHCRNYIPTDVICRAKVMQGFNVVHPMGFDAFGLPAENEAIKNKTHPAPMIDRYAATYRRQMELVGISYDWSRSFKSSDPDYYKWTQWIFEILYRKGLAYRKLASVNWCETDKTVLADEEVVGGLCWRCDNPVEKRWIPQWFFKITAYAERLIDDLDKIDWPEGIKNQQRNWIGKSEGVEFSLKVAMPGTGRQAPGAGAEPSAQSPTPDADDFQVIAHERELAFRVFTTRIDTIFGMTFCVLAPEHPLIDNLLNTVDEEHRHAIRAYRDQSKTLTDTERTVADREKTGAFTGAYAVNPANGERVPIWIADYVLMGYGTGAIMAVPGHDERDFEFATKFGIEVRRVIGPADASEPALPWTDKAEAILVNSGEYSGLPVKEAQEKLGVWMEALGIGERKTQYKLRDWLISRQRYWGCPIPIIHDADGGMHPVPEDCLPVQLPDVENYEPAGDGSSPLTQIPDFVNVADSDGRLGRRETDTMGGFACSSWYFLRFCDPHNAEKGWDPEKVKYWMPVDCYVGGAEHAVMHLLYARFWTKVLFDEGLVPVDEPFQRLMNQGQVLGRTPYRAARADEKLDVGQEGIQISYAEAASMPENEVIWRWARMSKSKGNVVTPEQAVEEYGADALRIYELFVAPFESDVNWSNEGMNGAARFLGRVFKFAAETTDSFDPDWKDRIGTANEGPALEMRRATHRAIQKATEDIDRFAFNTYVAALMTYLNALGDIQKAAAKDAPGIREALSEALESLILILAPAAPHTADEIWSSLGKEGFTFEANWPRFDPALTKSDTVTVALQVNGKLRDTLEMSAEATNEELEAAALASPKVQAHIEGRTVRKVIVVPRKLVNVVV
ncbi:MAG TPA: leucine--tRNA ligase [Fimbriimonadaceae bacterium]|nr:leucine--tRNA ligase [Fimbriimonadaceae bacterium]